MLGRFFHLSGSSRKLSNESPGWFYKESEPKRTYLEWQRIELIKKFSEIIEITLFHLNFQPFKSVTCDVFASPDLLNLFCLTKTLALNHLSWNCLTITHITQAHCWGCFLSAKSARQNTCILSAHVFEHCFVIEHVILPAAILLFSLFPLYLSIPIVCCLRYIFSL